MEIRKMASRLFILAIAFLFSAEISCQDLKPEKAENVYELVELKYGIDQLLVNGKYFENIYINDLGHPYFSEDEFKKGYLVLHNQTFDNLKLKYNIWDQTLLVPYSHMPNAAFIPPVDFIREFGINGHLFKKIKFENQKDQFFEEIYSGEINLLCSWYKSRDKSEHKVTFMAHKFSEPRKKLYVVVDNKPCIVNNRKALTRLFPEHKNEINQYIKAHKLKLYKSSNKQLSDLMAFCEKLTSNRQ